MSSDENDEDDGADGRRHRDAAEAGCSGLIEGFARSLKTGAMVEASIATKEDGPFVCIECHSDAVVRKCAEKRDHFAHHASLTPVLGSSESALHLECKREICDALGKRFPDGKWAVERPIPADPKRKISLVVPDISGRLLDQRLAIEIQASSLTIPKLVKRVSVYARRNVPMIWVVPLTEEIPAGYLFRPRLYERYLHSMYYGRTYYWLPGMGATVLPIHFSPASRFIDTSEWFDVEVGEERSAGGYEKTYKVIRKSLPGTPIDLAAMFKVHSRGEFTPENERKALPASLVWLDKLPLWWSVAEDDRLLPGVRGVSRGAATLNGLQLRRTAG